MRFLSLFSGIEAASSAWCPLGWTPVGFSEIEPFACAVLRYHHPTVPNLGDASRITDAHLAALAPLDLVVGGFPCQDVSVAGRRAGLRNDDGSLTRSGLFFDAMDVVRRVRPRWLLIENVPGLYSSNGGSDFARVLEDITGLPIDVPPAGWGTEGVVVNPDESGYSVAWACLDAQWFGVPQRRRRVFLVGHLGDWRRAAAVLFERHSVSGHPPPRRQAGQGVADSITVGANQCSGGPSDFDEVAGALTARYGKEPDSDLTDALVAHSLRAEGFDAGEDGTGRGTPLVPVSFDSTWSGDFGVQDDVSVPIKDGHGTVPAVAFPANFSNQSIAGDRPTLTANSPTAVAYQCQGSNVGEMGTLRAGNDNHGGGVPFTFDLAQITSVDSRSTVRPGDPASTMNQKGQLHAATATAVRRLTPREAERLQGFPDDWTLVPYRGKPAADGPRYRALGNSMAVPCMAWIGRRIQMVEALP